MRQTPRRHGRDDRYEQEAGIFDAREFDGLSHRIPAPDLTHEIMGRLGYEQAEPGAGRRQRVRRRTARTLAVFAAGLALAAGMHYYTLSQRARRAGLPTIPNAVSTSIEESGRAVSDFSRALRTILTPRLDPTLDNGSFPPSPVGPLDLLPPGARDDRIKVSRAGWSGLL
jgi:hypothetical protein